MSKEKTITILDEDTDQPLFQMTIPAGTEEVEMITQFFEWLNEHRIRMHLPPLELHKFSLNLDMSFNQINQAIDRGRFPYEIVWAKEPDVITINLRHI